jgi:hypothetical protein
VLVPGGAAVRGGAARCVPAGPQSGVVVSWGLACQHQAFGARCHAPPACDPHLALLFGHA